MGTAHSHVVAPVESYDEEPTKDQVHHRHKVLNQIKQKRKLTVTVDDTTDIITPLPSPVQYNKYKRKKVTREQPIFFAK